MLLSTLITQLADSRRNCHPQAADDAPDTTVESVEEIAPLPTLMPSDSGGVFVIQNGMIAANGKPLARPGAAAHVILHRLLAGLPVSGHILMNEYRMMRSTAMGAIARLEKNGLIRLESSCADRMRYRQTYRLSNAFMETLRPTGYNLHLF